MVARELTPRSVTRRTFLQVGAAAAAGGAATGFYTVFVEPHWLDVLRRPLPVRHLPPALQGRTLVQISDVHVGRQVDDDYLIASFERVAALQPDLVVLTGDVIGYHPGVFDQLAGVFRSFPRGRIATLAVLGNHDYGPKWSHPEIADRLIETVAPLGISVLRNEVRDVGGLQVAGLDDLWGPRFTPAATIEAIDRNRAAIVLSHNPDTVDLPFWGDYRGWILSGHTHGGQCKPPFLPPPILPVRNKRYTAGEFALDAGRRLYINRGVGHLTRVRFGVRPEITVFELQDA